MVLTQSAATSLFADKNPIGEIVSLENEYDYVVNAVIPVLPENSFVKAECFFSIQSMEVMNKGFLSDNEGWSVYTFVELKENICPTF